MAKDNFKATDATKDAGYAGNVGSTAAGAVGTGINEQEQGYGALGNVNQQQLSFAQMLQQQASGQGGPTMADTQVQNTTALNNANAAGFAASAKGLNPALAARQALMAQAGNNQQAAGQAAQTRIQEMQSAQAQEGNALAGAAGSAGAMTQAGTGLTGVTGQLANTSNQNIINNQSNQDQINAGVAAKNTSSINGAISGLVNGAGAAIGLAKGGEVPMRPDEWDDEMRPAHRQFAAGGAVGREPAPRMPQRSFAAQVAHHLKREYFDEGGTAGTPQQATAAPAAPAHVPTDAEVSAEGNVEKKKELEARRQQAMDEQALSDAAAQPKKAYGGDVDAGDQETEAHEKADTQPEDEYMAWGGMAGAHREYTRRMALGGMVGPGAGRAGSAPSGEMAPEMQVQGAKVRYKFPRPNAKGDLDYAAQATRSDGSAASVLEPQMDYGHNGAVTAAPTASGFRANLRRVAAGGARSTVADDRMEPLLNVGGTYRQPVNFADGGKVSAPQQDRNGGKLPAGHGGITRGPSLALMGAGGGNSRGIGPTAHFANGGVSDPKPDNAPSPARGARPDVKLAAGGIPQAGDPGAVMNAGDEMPSYDTHGNQLKPTGQGMTNGQPDASKPGFFDALGARIAQHFANSPFGSLIMGQSKPATSSGTPLAPGEQPVKGQPVGAVPVQTPAGRAMTQATGSPVEGRQLEQSAAQDENHAAGGRIDMRAAGGPVPGQAEVPGDDLQNDNVPAMLSPGEVVLPRTIAHKPHQAKKFVQHLQKHGGDGAKTLKDIKKRKAG